MPNKWNLVDVLPSLQDDEVHLWRIDLTGTTSPADRYSSLLSAPEQADAARRRVGQTRDHFIIGRACSRILLGDAFGIDPNKVNIAKGRHGKPEVAPIGGSSISFNIAHSKDTVLIALGRQGAVGVDVEYLDRSTNIMEIARGNFTKNEAASLAAIADPEARLSAFYRYWTRKEAIGKADGRGLLLPLTSFDVAFEPIDLRPVCVDESPDRPVKQYFVSDLDLGHKAMGALALETAECRVNRLVFPLQLSL